MKNSRGNALSAVSLACALNNLIGNKSAVLRDGDEVAALLFDKEGRSFLWNCKSGIKIAASIEAFHKSKKIQEQLGIDAAKAEYTMFTYPQAFCLKNQVLSTVVSMVKGIPDFSISPSLQYIELRQLIGGRPIEILKEFRDLLEKEITGSH